MNALPFLLPGRPDDVIAWRGGMPVTRRQFRRDHAGLAARLPDRPYILNHCEDRYCFLVTLAAALTRGQVSLFPSNRAPDVLAALRREYPQLYCLSDQAQPKEAAVMDTVGYATDSAADNGVDPAFPAGQTTAILFTSGSSGVPQRHTKTWGNLVRESQIAGQRLGLDKQRGGQVLATVPAQHMYGFSFSVILPAQWGYVLGAEQPFYPEDIRRALALRPGPAILVTTPLHIRACVLDEVVLPPLDFILSSTAPLDGTLAATAEARYGTRVMEFYGSTETGAIASRRQTESSTWRTFDGVSVTALESGFRITAPYLSEPQYLGDTIETRGPGEFVLLGRNTEIIKIAGKRAALGDLNRNLLAIEGVRDGTFFLPDAAPGRETRLTAFVVAPGLSRETILEALRQHLDAAFLPRPLHLVESLPRNATGKLPRGNLLTLHHEVELKESTG